MPRARMIKHSFFTNEALAALSTSSRLLFCAIMTIADREGRLEDRPARIKVECLPYDRVNVDGLLEKLAEAGFIDRYEVDSVRVIQIVNFSKHQRPHKNEPPSSLPARDISRAARDKDRTARPRTLNLEPRVPSSKEANASFSDGATATPSPRDRLLAAEKVNDQLGAAIDLLEAVGVVGLTDSQRSRLGGLLKKHGHGAAMLKALGSAAGADADPISWIQTQLQGNRNGAAPRPRTARPPNIAPGEF